MEIWKSDMVWGGGQTSGDVLVQPVLHCMLDSWPSHINQICCNSHMPKQHDKPSLLPGTYRTSTQCAFLLYTRCSFQDIPSKICCDSDIKIGGLSFSSFNIFWVIEKQITKCKIEEQGTELLANWSMSHCLGNSRGYLRHCCRKTGT